MKSMNEHDILILTGSLGEGHNQASKAIVESAKRNYPHLSVKVVDYLELTYPKLHTAGQYFFIQWMKHFPSVYGYLFQKTRDHSALIQMLRRLSSFNLHKISNLLEKVKPAVVVSTFPSAAAAIAMLKAMGLTKVPTVTVITDHTDHSFWIHSHTDHYMVGSEVVQTALQNKGVPASKISVTGIPVHPVFSQPINRDILRQNYGLESKHRVVLIMGGGEGMIDKEVVELIQSESYPSNIRFIIICGRNAKLYHHLQGELGKHPQTRIMGYVDRMHEMMACADLIVTKAGGLTVSEALTMERPMLLFKPLPGQEQDNADYLVGIGVARQAMEGELQRQLLKLITNPKLLNEMERKAAIFTHKESALSVLTRLLAIQSSFRRSAQWPGAVASPYEALNREAYSSQYMNH